MLVEINMKLPEKFNKKLLFIPLTVIILVASYNLYKYFNKPADTDSPQAEAMAVEVLNVKNAKSYKQEIEYAALVTSDQEAQLVAKAGGTVTFAKFNPGDKVTIGQQLIKIDDVTGSSVQSGFNSGQVKQAIIGVQQAESGYRLALRNYQNTLQSTERDLKAVEIARDQAQTGESNLGAVTGESLRTAEIGYDTAKIAVEQARLNLENRKKLAGQSDEDVRTSANTAADSIANTCGTIISGINSITGLDSSLYVGINYQNNLGVLDNSSVGKARTAYDDAKNTYGEYNLNIPAGLDQKISAVKNLVNKTKVLADAAKYMLDKSVSSNFLPPTAATPGGLSLVGLQSTAAGYQSQITGAINQINGAESALKNSTLGNDTTITALEKAYELAKQQEAAAKQNLENLKAGNKSQLDNAGFGVDSASNQYENIKIKLNSQVAVAQSQLEIARLSYSNASIALQNLYDTRLLVSPISGVVSRKNVSEGDTVTAGQLLAVISQPDNLRLQFYVDQESLPYLKTGQNIEINDNGKTETGKITSITPQADAVTKRFLVEVTPSQAQIKYSLGTVIDVKVSLDKKPKDSKNILLPLSAIEIGQNANTIMIVVEGKAQKKEVILVRVEGEAAEIAADLSDITEIIVKNNKLLNEGDPVDVKNR